jgi:Fur family transcriptional regulator, peroxide stress response regulator
MANKGGNDELVFFRTKCKENGLRVTHQKVIIYKELLKALDHPSPEQLFNRLKSTLHGLSFDTVYRTLSVFNAMGIIDLVEGYGTARRFDPKLEKHHHFQCRNCGMIIDFKSDYYDKLDIPKKIAKECKVIKSQVTIEGFCKKCRKELQNIKRGNLWKIKRN